MAVEQEVRFAHVAFEKTQGHFASDKQNLWFAIFPSSEIYIRK